MFSSAAIPWLKHITERSDKGCPGIAVKQRTFPGRAGYKAMFDGGPKYPMLVYRIGQPHFRLIRKRRAGLIFGEAGRSFSCTDANCILAKFRRQVIGTHNAMEIPVPVLPASPLPGRAVVSPVIEAIVLPA